MSSLNVRIVVRHRPPGGAAGPVTIAEGRIPATKESHADRQIERIPSRRLRANEVRVILRSDGSDVGGLLQSLKSKGVKVRRTHGRNGDVSLEISGKDLGWLEELQGLSVSSDAPVAPAPFTTLAMLASGFAREGSNQEGRRITHAARVDRRRATGNRIGIAIIDSGIAPVADLASRITAFYDFTNGQDAVAEAPNDAYGHGTHVAGLAAGNGSRSNGQYGGVAPNARLIGLKVLTSTGAGSTSDVIAAIEFATANRAALGIDVINLSVGHPPYESAATDPLVQAVEAASRAGIIVVVSAGNVGQNPETKKFGYGGILFPRQRAFSVLGRVSEDDGDH